MKQLVTGGAGFIGSNYIRWVLANTDDEATRWVENGTGVRP